jgi:preprotein translocase subunit SecE
MGVRISLPVQKKAERETQQKRKEMSKIRTYFEETTNELVSKVSWPTWQELQGSAMVVMVASIIIALVVFAMDSAFGKLMELAYQMINGL